MKILQVCQYFYPYLAGQERFVMELSKKLYERGYIVSVYTMDHLGNLPRKEDIDGIQVNRSKMLFSPLNNPVSIDFLRTIFNIRNFDVVHVHNEHSFTTLVTCLYNIIYKKPLILTCHGQLKLGSPSKDLLEKIYSRTIGKFIFNAVTQIVALSDDDKNYIENMGVNENKILILPNGVDNFYLDKKSLISEKEEMLNYLDGKKIILYVGRIIPRKGIETLIKSMPAICEEYKDIKLVIIGKGEYKKKAEDLCKSIGIASNVIFLSDLPDEILFAYYKKADVFVLPSLSEGLPTTILEAMYFRTAVVASDIPGIRCHFSDSAKLVPPLDYQSISETVISLFQDEYKLNQLKEQGKNIVMRKYTWDSISNSYSYIYTNFAMKKERKS